MPMRVLVTGATGFVGRAVVSRLVERGTVVHALARRPITIPGCETIVGDLTGDLPDLPTVDAVVHLASPPATGSPDEADALFRDVIVSGTERLIGKLRSGGVRRVVYASSVKVLGEASGARAWDEETPPAPESEYGRSKLQAERMLLEEDALGAVVLRFPILYGPGMTTRNMLRLFGAVHRGLPLPFGGLRNRRSLLYIEHAVDAIMLAVETPNAVGRTYLVADEPPLSTPQLVRAIGSGLGRRPRLLPVPRVLWRAAGRVGDLLPQGVPAVRTEQVRRLVGNLEVNSTKVRTKLGFAPGVPLDTAMQRTAAWFRTRDLS